MKPIARYDFEKKEGTQTRYILKSHIGADIPDFPATYKAGGQYIEFDKSRTPPRKGHRYFTHGFYLGMRDGKHQKLTGVNFTQEYPTKTYGDDKNIGLNNGLLFEFTDNGQKLTVYFFSEQAENAETLFEKWTAGELCLSR